MTNDHAGTEAKRKREIEKKNEKVGERVRERRRGGE